MHGSTRQWWVSVRLMLALIGIVIAFGMEASRADGALTPALDPPAEARYRSLAAQLRCLVCQNQSLADSRAGLAVDLKRSIREQLLAGASDQQVISFLTDRYGDFVLYRPPLKITTLLLWFGPLLSMIGAIALVIRNVDRMRRSQAGVLNDPADRRRAADLLRGNASGGQCAEGERR